MNIDIQTREYIVTVFNNFVLRIPGDLVSRYEKYCAPFDERRAEYIITSDDKYNPDIQSASLMESMLTEGIYLEISTYQNKEDIIDQAERNGLFT